MTVIAGVVALRREQSVRDEVCRDLRAAISRHPGERVQEFRGPRHYLVKFDIGAFGSSGTLVDEAGAITLLTGEPLLDANGRARKRPRAEDLADLHLCWRRGERSALQVSRGAFSLVHFDPSSHRVDLVVDKLGLRSLYYYVSEDYVVFASALRVLESSRLVPKRMDVRGVSEVAGMGFAFADRTPYADIKRLKGGQILRLSESRRSIETYWRWESIQPSAAAMPELLVEAYRIFTEAIRMRLDGDRTAVAFLSGGLDSRCIVTVLKTAGAAVRTYSVAFPDTLDEPLAEMYARAIGSVHRHVPIPVGGDPSPLNNVLPLLDEAGPAAGPVPDRPRVIWSGEGGSGIIGCVSQNAALVALLRQGRLGEAADGYLAGKRLLLSRRLFARPVADFICGLPKRGLEERLAAMDCADPGRKISLFDLVDYQSRHLSAHYEDIDRTRIELETPFYDSGFVAMMYSVAIDECLYHGFYHKWLESFPPVTRTVPWQTYPGHLPCPLPLPEGFVDQWSSFRAGKVRRTRARQKLSEMDQILASSSFPDPILSRLAVAGVRWMTRLGIERYVYVLDQAVSFGKYWKACGGRYAPFISTR